MKGIWNPSHESKINFDNATSSFRGYNLFSSNAFLNVFAWVKLLRETINLIIFSMNQAQKHKEQTYMRGKYFLVKCVSFQAGTFLLCEVMWSNRVSYINCASNVLGWVRYVEECANTHIKTKGCESNNDFCVQIITGADIDDSYTHNYHISDFTHV